jgi:hypothetical protein
MPVRMDDFHDRWSRVRDHDSVAGTRERWQAAVETASLSDRPSNDQIRAPVSISSSSLICHGWWASSLTPEMSELNLIASASAWLDRVPRISLSADPVQ